MTDVVICFHFSDPATLNLQQNIQSLQAFNMFGVRFVNWRAYAKRLKIYYSADHSLPRPAMMLCNFYTSNAKSNFTLHKKAKIVARCPFFFSGFVFFFATEDTRLHRKPLACAESHTDRAGSRDGPAFKCRVLLLRERLLKMDKFVRPWENAWEKYAQRLIDSADIWSRTKITDISKHILATARTLKWNPQRYDAL